MHSKVGFELVLWAVRGRRDVTPRRRTEAKSQEDEALAGTKEGGRELES